MEITYYDFWGEEIQEAQQKQTHRGKPVWKPNCVWNKLFFTFCPTMTTTTLHLLEKEISHWVKNLGVLQPH